MLLTIEEFVDDYNFLISRWMDTHSIAFCGLIQTIRWLKRDTRRKRDVVPVKTFCTKLFLTSTLPTPCQNQLFSMSRLQKRCKTDVSFSVVPNHRQKLLGNIAELNVIDVVPSDTVQNERLLMLSPHERCKTKGFAERSRRNVVSLSMVVAPKWSAWTYFGLCVCVRIDICVCGLSNKGTNGNPSVCTVFFGKLQKEGIYVLTATYQGDVRCPR